MSHQNMHKKRFLTFFGLVDAVPCTCVWYTRMHNYFTGGEQDSQAIAIVNQTPI